MQQPTVHERRQRRSLDQRETFCRHSPYPVGHFYLQIQIAFHLSLIKKKQTRRKNYHFQTIRAQLNPNRLQTNTSKAKGTGRRLQSDI